MTIDRSPEIPRAAVILCTPQELNKVQEAKIVGFDDFGLSATVQFTSAGNPAGSMTTYLVRGMVSGA